jgi:hypothetical protein
LTSKKILRGSKGTGQKQRNVLVWENGHRAFLLFEIETGPMWADEHKKKSSALGVAVPWMKGVRKFCKRTI